ncbi:Phenylacetate-coenzyme A ligase (plasmid) [Variovorax sp. SRS16]|uniref:phenylacetate--CoA ligase family protein n=1 Tax=Variovorax sp. SRS16 TaxID=282217 RepID=UPI001316274A|nr:phenylacetate--CoA ligase [Variovorax sp. SRS16]VTU46312.1 Phenylacetate-coenzyme A ligase [Variovorax sp. SRS16]
MPIDPGAGFGPDIHFAQPGDDLGRPYWNTGRETMPAGLMCEVQLQKLRVQLDYLESHSALYQRKFAQAGFRAKDLQTIDELAQLPFTTKAELRAGQESHPPFGLHQAAADSEIIRTTATSGTTGKPVFQAYTRHDVLMRSESIARALWSFGVRPGDRVVNGFALSMFNAGVPICTSIEHLGANSIPVGAEKRAEGMLRMMKEIRATAWIGTPSFMAYLTERCRDVLGMDPADLGVRVICGGGESGFEVPEFRRRIEEAWGTPHVYDFASSSDAQPNNFSHCHVREGKHQTTPDMALVQLIDPAAGTLLPLEDGAEGEYIFTHLSRHACGLVRYRSGDVLKVRVGDCACGRTGFRMDIVGRTDDMLIVRGVNLYPSAVQAVVNQFEPQLAGSMQIVLKAKGPKVEPPLQVRAEVSAGIEGASLETLKAAFENACREQLNVRVRVECVAAGSLDRTESKAKLIVVEP